MTKTLLLAAAAATLFAAPVSARHRIVETRSTTVATADLDLSRQRDVATFDRRVERAAQRVCGTASQWDLEGQNAIRACRATTVADFAPRREAMIAAARPSATAYAARD